MPSSSADFFPLLFPHKHSVCIPPPRVLHARLILRYSITRIILGEVPHYAIFSVSCHSLSLRPKYLLQHPILEREKKTIIIKEIRSTDSVKFTVMYYILQINGKHHTPTTSRTRATVFLCRTIILYSFRGIICAFTYS